MNLKQTLGHEIHVLHHLLERRMNHVLAENGGDGMTPVHGRILGFLVRTTERDIYQKDIEAEFQITRSSVASILKLMESKGYITRQGVAHDARLKKLVPTPLGRENFARIEESILQTEAALRGAVSPQDYAQLMRLLEQVRKSLS